jgi:hypothetical protein
MENDLFIKATRSKLRFNTNKGQLSVEDLFDLSLKSLDTVGQVILSELKPGSTSLLENPDPKVSAASAENELRLELIKFVIATKQDENKAAVAASAARQQRAFLMGLKEKRQIDAMESLTLEEIDAQLAALPG